LQYVEIFHGGSLAICQNADNTVRRVLCMLALTADLSRRRHETAINTVGITVGIDQGAKLSYRPASG